MEPNIVITLVIVGLALTLFVVEWFPADITALLVMVMLLLFKQVDPAQGISGFSNSATLTVMAMFILSAGFPGRGRCSRSVSYCFGGWVKGCANRSLPSG